MRSITPPATQLPIAQALTKNGNPKAVVRLLEGQVKLQPPNVDPYRTLADGARPKATSGERTICAT